MILVLVFSVFEKKNGGGFIIVFIYARFREMEGWGGVLIGFECMGEIEGGREGISRIADKRLGKDLVSECLMGKLQQKS